GLAQVEDLLDDGAVLALELSGLDSSGLDVGALFDLDTQTAVRSRMGGAGDTTMEAREGHRATAAGQPHLSGHLGDSADAGVFAIMDGDEEDTVVVADLDRQRHRHVR